MCVCARAPLKRGRFFFPTLFLLQKIWASNWPFFDMTKSLYFLNAQDHYNWYRGKNKKGFLDIRTESRLYKTIWEKYNLRLGLIRGGVKKYFTSFFAPQLGKLRQLYNKDTPSGIRNLQHVLHSSLSVVRKVCLRRLLSNKCFRTNAFRTNARP
jgi:hypothetical protein